MTESGTGKRGKVWFPLESNPDVMNSYIKFLGLANDNIQFSDVFGFEEELLEMVPKPVKAVVMLFPITPQNGKFMQDKVNLITTSSEGPQVDPSVFFLRQFIGNACGTIGILHALLNCAEDCTFTDGGFLNNFFSVASAMSPEARGEYLIHDDQLQEAQEVAAQQGQTANQPIEERINLHFVCFVVKKGALYELDGCKPFPVNWGPSSDATLLKDACTVVKEFMALNPEDMSFSVVALSKLE